MPIPQKIIKFLEGAKVKYEPIGHRQVFTAYDKAATLKVPQKIIGKTLVVKLDLKEKPTVSYGTTKAAALVLIPANKNLDKNKFKKVAKTRLPGPGGLTSDGRIKNVDFLKETWMKKNLKGVKVGAIPPFGDLWGLPTFVDKVLLKEPKIIISAGHYNWSIKISPANLKKLIPSLVIGRFSQTRK